MTEPIVSILVPVYGVEQYIERCAVSLFEQTYDNIEYVFVNDATKDNSIRILENVIARYPNRQNAVWIINHPTNKGISAARNTGVANSSGKYLLFVDSDDYIAKEAIEHLTTYAESNHADIVLFDTSVLTSNGTRIESVEYREKVEYISHLLQHTAKCAHWNKFYNGDFYHHSGIQACEDVRLADDYAVTPRIVHEAQTIAVLHEPLYFYETRNQSSYVHNLTRAAIESLYRADKVLVDWFRHIPDADTYKDVIDVLPIRSMVSLIKNADKNSWLEIVDVYGEYLSLPGNKMTWVNRVIYRMAQKRQWRRLQCFLQLYHLVMR